MDNKNVFIAIALSMSVLLFWAAFFETPQPVNNNTPQQQKKTNENIITPNINESLKVDKISEDDSKNFEKSIQKITDFNIQNIEKILTEKEKEISQI